MGQQQELQESPIQKNIPHEKFFGEHELGKFFVAGPTDAANKRCAGYLGSGYKERLVDYPIFDFRLLEGCQQKVTRSLFGSLDPLSITEHVVTRLKVPKTVIG